jgi:hypothetical protein
MYKPVDNVYNVEIDGLDLVDGKMQIDDSHHTLLSTVNSTALALSAGEVFTGVFETTSFYGSVSVLVIIDTGGGEKCTLSMVLSPDLVTSRQKNVEVSFGNSR